jgi:peptidoglycan/LPS O-acetylase OafA/YrhL
VIFDRTVKRLSKPLSKPAAPPIYREDSSIEFPLATAYKKAQKQVMSRAFSLYLDIVRLFAALLVLFYHANWIYRPGFLLTSLGHEGVVIFFVLSGFVIAYVADTRTQDFKGFMVARAARIFSVAIPAIAITSVLDLSGFWLEPDVYPVDYRAWDLPLVRVITSALFLNEIWTLGIQLFTNVPYWSLNYEVWYYVLFGVLFFIEGKKRWVIFALLCLFLGPKILLLLPVWWLGVWIYRSERLQNISMGVAWVYVVLSFVLAAMYLGGDLGKFGWDWVQVLVGVEWHRQLSFSRQFPTDYFLGVALAMHFVGMRVVLKNFVAIPDSFERVIRYLAGATFSVYLFHQPLLWFYSAVFSFVDEGLGRYVLVVPITIVTCFVLATYTEHKKDLWKGWVEALAGRVETLTLRLRKSSA